MSIVGGKPELAGKTIEAASIEERPSGDAELRLQFTDGSVAVVVAWKREGHSLEMNIDLSPNAHPQTDGGTRSTRVI